MELGTVLSTLHTEERDPDVEAWEEGSSPQSNTDSTDSKEQRSEWEKHVWRR